MQHVRLEIDEGLVELALPNPDSEILPGIRYGRPEELLTPAYWTIRCHIAPKSVSNFHNRYSSLSEEVGFCLLGGYGITAEVATAYFNLLKSEGIFSTETHATEDKISSFLKTPVTLGGKQIRYRFPNQRSRRLALALSRIPEFNLDIDTSNQLRERLLELVT